MNSGPLSVISIAGFPRVSIKRCSTSATTPPTDRGIDINRQACPGEIVDDGEEAKAPAVVEHIENEVERPAFIDASRRAERRAAESDERAGASLTQLELRLDRPHRGPLRHGRQTFFRRAPSGPGYRA